MKNLLSVALFTTLFLTILTSCTSSDNILNPKDLPSQELYNVNLTFSSSDFTITTRAVTSEIPEALNRLTVSVFRGSPAEEVATISQSREAMETGETFGSLSFQLPAGTYKFVAVLHEVPSDKLSWAPASITSPTEASLPNASIYDTYCCVQEATVTASASNSLTLALGTRINAKFQLETLDDVPEGVTSIAIYVNKGVSTTVPGNPTINPTTGLATADWQYVRNFTTTSGEKFNRTCSILLNEDFKSVEVKLVPQPASATYPSRSLESVSLQRNHITHAKGYLFNQGVNSSFTLDTSLASDIPYNF